MKHALDDIVVVELAEGVAGAYCGKLFADLGATVVKVERPDGDPLRHLTAAHGPDGTPVSGTFLHLASNKRSVVVDDSPPSRERLSRLLDRADLVIAEATRGALADWSLDWDAIHGRRPRLSVVHISGYGATGPYADYEWDDITVQAMAGTLLLQNDADQDPLRFPGALGFCIVGHMAALGALGAVTVARQSGAGSFIDCAAVEVLASMPPKATTLLAHHYRGGVARPNAATNPSTLIPTGVFPCLDGHVALMSTPQQLREMLDVLDDDDLRAAFARPDAYERGDTKEAVDAALYPWLLSHTRAECTALAQAAGWPFAGVNTPGEVLAADHLHQRGFWVHSHDETAGAVDVPGPWCRFGEGGWALRRPAPALGQPDPELEALIAGADAAPSVTVTARPPEPPLRGVRVVDLTTVWAGPYAAMLLADLGAEVIRVENPFVLPPTTKGYQPRPTISDLGFLSSGYGPAVADRPDRPWNRHSLNNSICRNKLSCTMDTRRAEGRELLMRLVEVSDVFIENFKASGLTRMGIQVSELVARNPRLIVIRMPPAGHTGDWAHYAGFGAEFDGLSGLAYVCGHVGSDPVTTPATTYMDCASGPAAAFATFVALRYRDATGRGQVVELAQSENVINHLGDLYVDCQLGTPPERMGNRNRWSAPQGLYRDRNGGWLALSVRDDREWKALTDAIGRPDLAGDERFATNAGRQANHDALDTAIAAWVVEREAEDAFHTLQRVGVAAAPLLDEPALSADPQVVARGWEQPLLSLDVGVHPHPGLPYRGIPQEWHRGSPVLGQDNEYVFRELLGISAEEYARLQAEHHITDDYLDASGAPYEGLRQEPTHMDTVILSVEGHVATVTMDNPPVNASSPQLLAELKEVLDSFVGEREVRVAVLTGAGSRAFMAGADLKSVPPPRTEMHPTDLLDRGKAMRDLFWSIYDCAVPVAVNGPAIGAGLAIAAVCDIIVAAEHATFQAAEINVGLLGASSQFRLLVGRHKARELFFTGRPITAGELHALGSVSRVVPAADLLAAAHELAAELATKSPIALRLAKESMNRVEFLALKDAYRLEQDYTARLLTYDDAGEARRAWQEKRPPAWTWT